MDMHFLRGNPQAPKGHVIFVARSTQNPHTIFCTYCIVPPTPMSFSTITKFLPPIIAAQLSSEDIQEASNMKVMPIPPMLEEGNSLEYFEMLAERRDDDLCDLGTINPRDENARMQMVVEGCQEYGQLYFNYTLSFEESPAISAAPYDEEPIPLDDLDADELLFQTMTDRQRLTELGKLIGTARYAQEGNDTVLLQDTQRRMQRIGDSLPDKYRTHELIAAAVDSSDRGAKLAQLYLERSFKLLNEEYADIPRIEQSIRELQ